VGVVVIQDQQVFASRDVQKGDARPGGYVATGGHGGIVGSFGPLRPPALTYRPVKQHTYCSAVNLSHLPETVDGTQRATDRITRVAVRVKNERGELLPTAIPKVTIVKHARYLTDDASGTPDSEVDLLARIDANLRTAPLAGFVAEATAPFGSMSPAVEAALRRAALSGMPVVKVSRGNAEGIVPANPVHLAIAGSNLTATKARLLLMACLLKFGALPLGADPANPTKAEVDAVRRKVAEYQEVFNTH